MLTFSAILDLMALVYLYYVVMDMHLRAVKRVHCRPFVKINANETNLIGLI